MISCQSKELVCSSAVHALDKIRATVQIVESMEGERAKLYYLQVDADVTAPLSVDLRLAGGTRSLLLETKAPHQGRDAVYPEQLE